ncbi:MAG: glycosyl transferase [Planctomycetota bacterium]
MNKSTPVITKRSGHSRSARLSNGRLTADISEYGLGQVAWNEFAVTPPEDSPLLSTLAPLVYCRDVQTGSIWSNGLEPTLTRPDRYAFHAFADRVQFDREDQEIGLSCSLEIDPAIDVLLCRCTLTNQGRTARDLEVASYLEIVLQQPDAFAAHPAFSKLFLKTAWLEEEVALHFQRRPRDVKDAFPQLLHFLLTDEPREGRIGFETSRVRFLGRGCTPSSPAALRGDSPGEGRDGTVLEPMASLRFRTLVAAGESRSVLLGTLVAAHPELEEVREQIERNWRRPSGLLDPVVTVGSPRSAVPMPQATYTRLEACGSSEIASPDKPVESLDYENGWGGFSAEGDEYVIRLRRDETGNLRLPPTPWVNVIANPESGCIVSEMGTCSTWVKNSRQNRLTPWFNDPVTDPFGEAYYVRDEDSRRYWSALPGPSPHGGPYEVRHGFGYTHFIHQGAELAHEATVFVPADGAAKVLLLKLNNQSHRPRNLSVFGFQAWVMGDGPVCPAESIQVDWDERQATVLARHADRVTDGLAFSWVRRLDGPAETHHASDGNTFLNMHADAPPGHLDAPHAVTHLDCLSDGQAGDPTQPFPAAALQLRFVLPAQTGTQILFVLGQVDHESGIDELRDRFSSVTRVEAERRKVDDQWRRLAKPCRVKTPSPALNLMANGWLLYQNISGRLWGRSSFYQGGGAYGFRDQLQDAAALMYVHPEMTRRQIVRHAARQFPEGDVLHWWHPDTGMGIRTRFADDLLWLPLVTAEYVRVTGDSSVWDESLPFLSDRALTPDEDEALLSPSFGDTTATVLEHCCLAIERSLPRGGHGLPLMGTGDWNDGMNRVGSKGRGESVWLGFFLYRILDLMVPTLEERGDVTRVERYRAHQQQLRESLNTKAWDGNWFLRAFHDDGCTLGSARNSECQIDALSQAWSVISKAGDEDKQQAAMEAVESRLVDESAGIIRLLTPPFSETCMDPGYIKGYLPGLRENGGQYTHGILWAIRALAELGRGKRATELLEMICPVTRTATPQAVQRYQTEPYVIPADVYSVPPHDGRGGWSWYTGSAGWMYRILWETILGVTIRDGKFLQIAPCIPCHWPGFEVTYTPPQGAATYSIEVHNRKRGVTAVTLDGATVPSHAGVARIPLCTDNRKRHVIIDL